ncbi:MAG: PEP/pyruvate-binding domain-containing protein, partial [Bacteroidota bacterium]
MSKLSQLQRLQQLRLPVPKFQSIGFKDFQNQRINRLELKFPVAVRSTFEEEDGIDKSYAGHFHTVLQVEQDQLDSSIKEVFDSYPAQEEQQVIVQEMIDPLFSGVLFAYRQGVWKLEVASGLGEQVVGGQVNAATFLLPRFNTADRFWSRWFRFWKGCPIEGRKIEKAFIELSVYTEKLLRFSPEAAHGLDIEFSITKQGLYFLQARPITTPDDAEMVLTSANHKEILPPQPSPLMTDIISSAGEDLFDFYRSLDASLPPQPFLVASAGMPWINLSALLGMMIHWGLPTALVAQSVGAVDVYKVGFRWWRFLTKVPVFIKMQLKQIGIKRKIENWVKQKAEEINQHQQNREGLWKRQPAEAAEQTLMDFRKCYIELVTYMQLLTGAMSGPVAVIRRLGWLEKYALSDSASTDYFKAYQAIVQGDLEQSTFLAAYGHRGFYESDIGQRRFWEYTQADWAKLLKPIKNHKRAKPKQRKKRVPFFIKPIYQLIHTREWIRHQSMQFFWSFR